MYSVGLNLPDPIREWLTTFEEENQVPVRVFEGRMRDNYTPPPFELNHLIDTHTSEYPQFLSDASQSDQLAAMANGLTIVSWGTVTGGGARVWNELPINLYRDAQRRSLLLQDVMRPGDSGLARIHHVVDAETGEEFPLCEIGERIIWYYPNIARCFDEPEQLDFDVLFRAPYEAATDPNFLLDLAQMREEANAREFVKYFTETFREPRIQAIRDRVHQHERNAQANLEAYGREQRAGREAQAELDAVCAMTGQEPEKLIEEYKALQRHPRIVHLEFRNGVVTIDTDPITMTNPDDSYEQYLLGRFRITYNISNGTAQLNNMDGRRRDRDHPHVEHGNACWGDLGPRMADVISSGQVAGAFELTLQYLESWNPHDDWGRFIQYWREAPVEIGV